MYTEQVSKQFTGKAEPILLTGNPVRVAQNQSEIIGNNGKKNPFCPSAESGGAARGSPDCAACYRVISVRLEQRRCLQPLPMCSSATCR